MKHLKKQLALFLAVCMLLSMLPLQAFAAEEATDFTAAVTSQLDEGPLQEDALEEDDPTDEEDVPTDEENVPTDEEDVPTDEEDVPTDEVDVPTDEEDVPTDEVDVPTDEVDVPTDEEDVPSDEGNEPTEAVDETTGEENLVAMAEETPEEQTANGTITVIAGSDFQNPSGNTAGAQVVTSILTQMQNAGYTSADGFLFCGDYDYSTVGNKSSTEAGITALKNAVNVSYSTLTDDRMVFVEGNHDAADASGLAISGARDTTEYGVYVINEDDYMWKNSDVTTIQNTAASLKMYLEAKVAERYSNPIFVVSHLPLHYSMRTRNDGDGMYANYIFDVLNEAGASGLNIIFLYGHDHSNGWDDYLGGSAVYLKKGDQINIAQASRTEFKEETLNFTYLNAGYTGYYENHNGADDTLTMTVFNITDSTVTVERFDANGKHNLKSAGVTNSYKNESGYAPNTTVYKSPQTVGQEIGTTPATVSNGNVSVTAPGLTSVTVTKKPVSFDTSVYSAYASYDITPEGYTAGDNATVTITLDESDGFDASREVTVIDKDGSNPNRTVSITNGKVTFTTTHFSTYDIAQVALVEPTERTYTLVTSLDELVSGDQYLLIYNGMQFVLPKIVTKSNSSGSQRRGMDLEATDVASGGPATITGQYQAKEWQLVSSSEGWLLSNGTQQIKLTNTDNLGITATFEDAGSPFILNFNTSHLVSFTYDSWELNYNSRGLINGYDRNDTAARMYIYHLTSTGTVDPSGGNWVEISNGQGKTIFRLANSLTSGKKYLIVNSNAAGDAKAVNLNGTSINKAAVTITADSGGNYIEVSDTTPQWTYTNAGKFQNVSNTSRYLRGGKNAGDFLKTTGNPSEKRTTWQYDANYGLYYEGSNSRYINSSFKMLSPGSTSNRVYIYEEGTLTTTAEYAKLTGSLEYTVTPGTSAAVALAAVKTGIDVVVSTDKTNGTTLPDDDANITWTLDSSYQGEAGEYAVTISYKNQVLGTAKVVVPKLTVTKIEVAPMEGTVKAGASNYAKTGSKLTVTYSDGSTRTVDVTLGMLSGNFNKNVEGEYTGLTITYEGKSVTGYTLHVTPKTGNNYPEYPHEGAVRVGKTAEGVNFQSSGIAKVELSATGVPVKKGADVIIMVDTSSSMNTNVSGSTRIQVLKESLRNLMTQFQAVGADGDPLDIRVAIADFNGYVTSGEDNTPYRLKSVDHLSGTSTRGGTNSAKVYTGSEQLNTGAFVTARDAASVVNSIETHSGTNYDYAFDAVYQLGEAILAQNAQDGEERDLFVIFMSDGAPFQYNYFSSQSEATNWNNWLQGTVTDNMWDSNAHNYFYNGSGNKHRMAEAIKGNPDEMYTVIRKDSTDNYGDQQYMTQVSGLGATMYSIGFCLEKDNQITVASMEHVLKNISSDPDKFYYSVDTAAELSNAFTAIGNEIAYAATNARFVDTMGANYNLQMASSTYEVGDGTTDTITPEITVQAYDIYTAADGVAESEIGKRKGTSTVLETVRFNENGTEAYSDKKDGNILIDGVICANTFWYNTTGNTVSIDTNGDGTNDYDLAPETFYWKMGTINQTELALSYYVYLTGSQEGTREAGSYPTNESATLYYTNWLDNAAKKDTVSPVLAWDSANVSYAFYLVNENGEIIVNKSTGLTGSFANKVAVTNPVVYSEVKLNSAENVQADIVANGVLPEGYTLYDTDAAYNVRINSNSTGSWTITKGTDTATTYVTEYGGDPTTELSTENAGYDYTHTVVWFAVTYTVKAIPDAVVIDYGLPVDIHVLKNDLFYDKGTLEYVGAEKTDGQVTGDTNAAFTTTEFTGKYGKATVIANTSVPEDSVVRYTPANMQMNGVDKFSYAVNYTGSENSGYYYGTVTVIPATTIYYEDSFVTFNKAKNIPKGNNTGVWTVDGTEQTGAVQDEDRPGSSSLSEIDANNLYGFDSHYTNFTTYSLGTAHKVTVDAVTGSKANAPEACFTFTGTGFDIISLTDNDSGTITVTVKDKSTGGVAKKWSVDNYYGYKYDEQNGWIVDKTSRDTIWQVPVIKIEGLAYGTYDVTIQTAYMEELDHQEDGSYSFWLDAIRVYDPAKNDETANDAHKQDQEFAPQYMTLRDLLVEAQKGLNVSGQAAGAVFIDGKDNTIDINDYANPGPNHETYLAYRQGVSFKLSAAVKPDVVQLGAKLACGEAATLRYGDKDFQTLTTASDLYYKLDGLNWTRNTSTGKYETGVITLSNSTQDAVISITNLKFTTDGSEAGVTAFYDRETVEEGPMLMRAMYCPVEEEVFFEPAYFSTVWKAGRVNKWSVLTVVTSEDVDAITVNGQEITKFVRVPEVTFKNLKLQLTHKRVWTYKERINTAGSYTYDVTAYSADGTASRPVETVLTVSKR